MAKDTWALLGVFAAGFLLLAGLILGVYDRLDARIQSVDLNLRDEIRQVDAKLSGEIKRVDARLSGEIEKLQVGQGLIRERLVRLETAVGVKG
ncbi:MAG: hypothetical protein OXP09_18440 [Gammaproteobacteria bacterium]|nr:hypothetical protein [Gammaproteobacteria bacterium]MDE0367541.1 hypothetical protein [Gammaproteobacteria bacterium]